MSTLPPPPPIGGVCLSVHVSHRLLRGSLTFCLIVSPCRVMQGGSGQCDSEPQAGAGLPLFLVQSARGPRCLRDSVCFSRCCHSSISYQFVSLFNPQMKQQAEKTISLLQTLPDSQRQELIWAQMHVMLSVLPFLARLVLFFGVFFAAAR